MKNIASKVGAEFVKTLYEELKKEIRLLVRQIILDILKDDLATQYLMIERLVNLGKNIVSVVDDYRKCKSVIDSILQLFNLIPKISLRNEVPVPILKVSQFLPGYSPNRALIETIKEMQKLGLPTGPTSDGSPNLTLQSLYAIFKGGDNEAKVNGKVEATFAKGSPPIIQNLKITGKYL